MLTPTKIIVIAMLISATTLVFWYWPEMTILYQTRIAPHFGTHWYALYLTDGRVLYGRIKSWTTESIKLEDVYYSPKKENPEEGFSMLSGGKAGWLLPRSDVLYWEEIGRDSKVLQLINNQK